MKAYLTGAIALVFLACFLSVNLATAAEKNEETKDQTTTAATTKKVEATTIREEDIKERLKDLNYTCTLHEKYAGCQMEDLKGKNCKEWHSKRICLDECQCKDDEVDAFKEIFHQATGETCGASSVATPVALFLFCLFGYSLT